MPLEPVAPRAQLELAEIAAGGVQAVESLKETIFSETSHLKRATLAPLERGKKIEVRRPGPRNIPGQYPPGTTIRFIDRQPVI